jgi:uncharacterized membrane protein YhiD involved in acid resistance
VIFKDSGGARGLNTAATILSSLRSEDIEGTDKMRVQARIRGPGLQDQALEQPVVRLSLESGVSSVSWAVHVEIPE